MWGKNMHRISAASSFVLASDFTCWKAWPDQCSISQILSSDSQELIMSRWRLEGKNILVTGGTKGIGKAIVEECASLGATVYTCARNEDLLQECVTDWTAKGFRVVGFPADLSSEEGRRGFHDRLQSELNGRLDGLVNNVGTNIRKKAMEYSDEEYHTIMETNLHAVFHFTRLFQPLMKQTAGSFGDASIVNIGSVAGKGVKYPCNS